MSRIGKKPIPIPAGVTVQIGPDAIDVKGPKGTIRTPFPPGVTFTVAGGQILTGTVREDRALGKFQGLGRSLVANAVKGVTEGFKKELDITGVGYRAELKGRQVVFALGYSHPVVLDIPEGIEVTVDQKQTHVVVSGIDRQKVGQVAADIRAYRKPDPYQQKGVRYTGEVLKKKAGKQGA
jgi:large subunit ribosomal protein L6